MQIIGRIGRAHRQGAGAAPCPGASGRLFRHTAWLVCAAALGVQVACTRPLSEGERDFATALFGDGFNAGAVGVAEGTGLLPPPGPAGNVRFRAARTRPGICGRDKPRPVSQPPAAFAVRQRLHYVNGTYTADALAGWPDRVRVPHAVLLAHELTHVWQWQNRHLTRYSALKALMEGWRTPDPYFYRIAPGKPFLSYGFEQQAAMVQDYVCFRLLEPDSARLAELRAVLAPVFPLNRLEAALVR